ncbi:allantoin permease [Brachybacterium sp. P6-10-X1]|uniref:purine-cytosine permease family protein n=1 Tax=Brachybacterium sp. P6-10-X1 TaxID=1903186 RepID=UPI000971A885|nr:cytosine permease [Brachybacterium sp. P6-10-X1]APX31776.1 allantoin permease [Brachybacterium sp. P6-10-X1]
MATVGHDDFALSRVPRSERYGFVSVLLQWVGNSGSLSQFMLGAAIGLSLGFWQAAAAFTLGAVLLEIVIFFVGFAGQREGLSMVMLTRFTGFGRNGSALVSLVIAISLIGWFGVQNGIFGTSMNELVGGPVWMWCVISGVVLTALVIYGFKGMLWISRIAVPLFFGLIAYTVITTLSQHSLAELIAIPPPENELTIASAATIIAGGFMTGAIIAPDMTRFNSKGWHVAVQSGTSLVISEYLVGLTGVLLGHLVGTSDVTSIVLGTSGAVGLIIIVLATMKINDNNLYSGSLGIVNFAETVFGVRIHRGAVTIAFGILGTLLSAIGFLDYFTSFLSLLGVAIPPIGGIIVAEYYIVRRQTKALDETRASETLPRTIAGWVPGTLVVWLLAFGVGWVTQYFALGIPVINSLVTAMLLYLIASRAGLITSTGAVNMRPEHQSATTEDANDDAPTTTSKESRNG